MGWFDHARDDALVILKAENSDLRAQLRAERTQFAEERQQLLDRIIALSRPEIHRELHPRAAVVPQRQPQRKVGLPGSGHLVPRPDPPAERIDPEALYHLPAQREEPMEETPS